MGPGMVGRKSQESQAFVASFAQWGLLAAAHGVKVHHRGTDVAKSPRTYLPRSYGALAGTEEISSNLCSLMPRFAGGSERLRRLSFVLGQVHRFAVHRAIAPENCDVCRATLSRRQDSMGRPGKLRLLAFYSTGI